MTVKKNLAVLLVAVLLIYEIWYIEEFGAISNLLQALAVLLAFVTVWLQNGKIRLPSSLLCWLIFGIYALFTGIWVTSNSNTLISSLITYFSFLLVCILIYDLCTTLGSTQWVVNIVLIANIICAISVIFFGEAYDNGIYVITMGAENNPNYLGISMLYGIFACFTRMDFRKWQNTLLYSLVIVAFSYVIVLSGSRSALLGLVIMIACCWLFGRESRTVTRKIGLRHLVYFVGAMIAVFLIGRYLLTEFIYSAAMKRLLLLTQAGGIHGRTDLYKAAISLFAESPVIGIGYNNFSEASGYGYFSHSTYAETLACTGILGCILWFAPYLGCIRDLIQYRRKRIAGNGKWISLFVVSLFMGIFGIVYYTMLSMLMYTILFAQLRIVLGGSSGGPAI